MSEEQKSTGRRSAKQSEVMKEQMAKKAACRRQMKEKFKTIDYFGQNVTFTWNGEDQYKTTFGATISMILMIILIAYGLSTLAAVINRDSPTVTSSMMMRDKDDDSLYTPYDSGFDFAFGLGTNIDKSIAYFTVTQIHNYYNETNPPKNRSKTAKHLETAICGNEHFSWEDQNEISLFGISQLNCITENDYYLQGNFYRESMYYLEIKLWKCQNSTIGKAFPGENIVCKNQTYIDSYLDGQTFSFAFINNLFASNDFDEPIQPYIDDSLFFELDSQISKKANFFVMQSEASLTDSVLPIVDDSNQDLTFHQISNIRTYEDRYSSSDGYLVAIYIRSDRQYFEYTRTVNDILTWLGDIGGLQGTLLAFGMFVVGFITQKMFMSKIIRQIYQIRKYENLEIGNNQSRNKIGIILPNDTERNIVQSPGGLKRSPSQEFKEKESQLQNEFKSKQKIQERDVANILYAFINRTRFKYTVKDIITFILNCMCFRSVEKYRKQKHYKKHFLFEKAEEKFMQELDVVRIEKTLRKFKMLAQALLSQKHRLVLRFQRQNLVETSSSSSDSDNNAFDTVRLMEQENPLIRLVMFGKLKKMMMQFAGKNVETLERNMMRGMYIRRLKDFAEEQREIVENHTMLDRLLEGMKMDKEAKDANVRMSQTINVGPNVEDKWQGGYNSNNPRDEVDELLEGTMSDKTRHDRTVSQSHPLINSSIKDPKTVLDQWEEMEDDSAPPKQAKNHKNKQ